MIKVYTDGLCQPVNPGGVATYGFEIRRNGNRIHEAWGAVGKGDGMSNNVAEYTAVENAAKWLLSNGFESNDVVFHSDSKLVVNQMNGEWRVRNGLYLRYYENAVDSVKKLRRARFEWVPREQNEYADALTEKAYREYLRTH